MIMKSSTKENHTARRGKHLLHKKAPVNLYGLLSLQVTVIDNEIDPYGGPPIKY